MNDLLEIKDNRIVFAPQALSLKPFRALWDRDDTINKDRATKELCFIYYYSHFKSEFSDLLDDQERKEAILEVIPEVVVDELVLDACDFFEERQSTTNLQMLKSAKKAANKIKDYYDNVDLEKLDTKTNKPVWDVTKLQNSIRDLANTIKGLNDLEAEVKKEIENKSNMKGSRSKKLLEDGLL